MRPAWAPRIGSGIALAALLLLLLGGAAPSAERALGAACPHANSEPREVERGKARKAVVCLINERRAVRGKPRLALRRALGKAAGRHSRRMLRDGCFSHRCPGEKDLVRRVARTRYLPCRCSWRIGENIAWGTGALATPRRIVRSWMSSPPHRSTMLAGGFAHVGVGVAWGRPGNARADAAIFTADFGYRR